MAKLDKDEETALTEAMEIVENLRTHRGEVDVEALRDRLQSVSELLRVVQV